MSKYNIEGNIDFFSELNKMLDDDDNNGENDDNICLITNLPLTDNYVKLNCGHKFNYEPLCYDLTNYKSKFNHLEKDKLGINQIRCPYCRHKQNGLLPYYDNMGIIKICGVNYCHPNEEVTKIYYIGPICEYCIPNPEYNNEIPESQTNLKYLNCHITPASKISIPNPTGKVAVGCVTKYQITPAYNITYGDNKTYCYTHKKQMIKHYKEKEKDDAKKAKAVAKLEKAKEKAAAKMKATLMKISDKNVVIGKSDVNVGCTQILKTGKNKGSPCGCKIFSDNLCKRHQPIA